MTRVYCWYTGNVFELDERGLCPECGVHTTKHRDVDGELCQSFAECKMNHGHPCELAIGHSGSHACPSARQECPSEGKS